MAFNPRKTWSTGPISFASSVKLNDRDVGSLRFSSAMQGKRLLVEELHATLLQGIINGSGVVTLDEPMHSHGDLDFRDLPAGASHSRPAVPSDDELAKQFRTSARAKGLDVPEPKSSAAGSNADLLRGKDSALKEYIANLKQETAAIGQNEKALFIARAEIEAASKAKEDFNNHLRASKTLLHDRSNNAWPTCTTPS